MSHLGIYKSEETILLTEVSAAVKENRIDEAIYIATTRSIGYVHTHDHILYLHVTLDIYAVGQS